MAAKREVQNVSIARLTFAMNCSGASNGDHHGFVTQSALPRSTREVRILDEDSDERILVLPLGNSKVIYDFEVASTQGIEMLDYSLP
jgi:hypothetical protein